MCDRLSTMTKRANLKINPRLHHKLKQEARRQNKPLQWLAEEFLFAELARVAAASQPEHIAPIAARVMAQVKENKGAKHG